MKRILFVCLGNICRSPIAEGVARHIITQKGVPLKVDSAGTSAWHQGEAPCTHSIKVCQQHGIDISKQTSRPVKKSDKADFDYIVAMDAQNKKELEAMGFQDVILLGDLGGYDGADVPDPYYFPGFEGFEKVYEMIARATGDLIAQIASNRD